MGVRGLRTFIRNKREKFLSDLKLYDSKIIVDGLNLLHVLFHHYEESNEFGGNYDHFAEKCKEFFKNLSDCNVTPVIVFDGAYDPNDMKLTTIFTRLGKHYEKVKRRPSEVLPLLSKLTFCHVLTDLSIKHVTCFYEADREIAVLANELTCPVLSDDSDFYVYDIENGCISPEDMVKTPKLRNATAGTSAFYLPVKLYTRNLVLEEEFKMINDEYIFAVFATLIGNDYFDSSNVIISSLKDPNDKLNFSTIHPLKIQVIVDWINRADFKSGQQAFENISKQLKGEKVEKFKESVFLYKDIKDYAFFNLKRALHIVEDSGNGHVAASDSHETATTTYQQLPSSSSGKSTEEGPNASDLINIKDCYSNQLPSWFVEGLLKGEVSCSFFLNIAVNRRLIFKSQVEELTSPSSYTCSKDIRRVIYRIVLGKRRKVTGKRKNVTWKWIKVREHDRIKKERSNVKPVAELPGIFEFPSIKTMPTVPDIERKTLLFAAFGAELDSVSQDMDGASHLLIRMLILWKRNSGVTKNQLYAMIITIITLHAFNKSGSTACKDILDACQTMPKKEFEDFKKSMEIYLTRSASRMSMEVVHGVAHFQTCFLHTHYLNQLLQCPVRIPAPYLVLNCTLVHNILENTGYVKNILERASPIHKLFEKWEMCVMKHSEIFEPQKCTEAYNIPTSNRYACLASDESL